MAKNKEVKIAFIAENKAFDKALDNSAKRLARTQTQSKKTKKEVSGLGQSFTQAANNVAIFNGQLDPISGRLSAIGTGLARFGAGGVALGAGLGALTLATTAAIKANDEYETRQLRFNALLTATSHSAKLTTKDLEALANQIGKDTLSNTEEAAEGINALLTFRKVQGENFKQTIKLARDAQVAFGGNLREGVVAFGKALNDPIANLGALSRKGIQFNDSQKETIRTLWEMGDTAAAQNIILEEMRNQFGGLAEKEAKTLSGSIDGLSHAWDRLWETMGRTGTMTAAADGFNYTVNRITLGMERVSSLHSEQAKDQDKIAELVEAETKALERKLDLEKQLAEGQALWAKARGDERGRINDRLATARITVKAAQDEYKASSKALTDFFAEKHEKQKKAREAEATAEANRLAEEKENNQKRFEEAVKSGDKIRNANRARFEDSKAKVERKYQTTQDALEKAYNKEIYAAEKSGADINAIKDKYDNEYLIAKKGRADAIAKIDKIATDKAIAEANRRARAEKVALSELRKRKKFLAQIAGGSGADAKRSDLQFKYEDDLAKLNRMEQEKTATTLEETLERTAIFDGYREQLRLKYHEDVKAFNEAEASKTLRAQEESAKRAADKFKRDTNVGFSNIENGAGGVEDFFGVNIDENAKKQQLLEEQLKAHLEEVDSLKLDADEKQKRRDALNTAHKLKQAEVEKEGRKRATQDTWSAIATLGASGSKKLFAVAKAANIAKAVMNTYTAATNALATVPVPFNYAAAAAITAAGLVNVAQIRAQQPPQAHDGIDYVPREGTYLLDKGERVLDSRLNADLKNDLKNRSQGGQGDMHINLTIPDTGNYNAMEQWYEDNSDRILEHFRYASDRP